MGIGSQGEGTARVCLHSVNSAHVRAEMKPRKQFHQIRQKSADAIVKNETTQKKNAMIVT